MEKEKRKEFKIKKKDWDKLLNLSGEARNTPVIFTPASGQSIKEVRSWADYAYDNIYDAWKAMGKEYGFDGSDVIPLNESERKILAFPLKQEKEDPHTCPCNDDNCPKEGEYDMETDHIEDCPCKECHVKLG